MTREEAKEFLIDISYKLGNISVEYLSEKDGEKMREAIEALAQEPTTKNDLVVDCISRADAIQAMQDKAKKLTNEDTINGLCGAVTILFDLPSVTPKEPRWIPVSEKLPNDRDWYLGIFKESDTGWINPLPFICDYVGKKTEATTKEFWILRGFTDRDYKDCDYYYNLECVAWMPLPKQYEPQESEEKE